ncbi:H repeat-associated protein YhhI (ORF-H) [Escherichia coli H605]|uniref:H repeat-associated protein YhhI (ORF-H) n=1 Tax=Escherichia coli H605 TaxID=656410 RepID=A0AAJ3U0T9_ECOLX|nr:H repeat-associated protein YhhI (ORF-H) [Escherichia coli H605]
MGCQKDIAEKKSVFILFAMSLMNLLILRLNGKD